MKGWLIFWHSVKQLFGNLGVALRLTALPTLICVGSIFALNLRFVFVPYQFALAMERGLVPWPRVAILALIVQVMFVWIAVNWHRYVLREEPVGQGLPPIRLRSMGGYFLATTFLTVCVVLPLSVALGVLLGIPMGIYAAAKNMIALAILVLIFTVPFLSLCTVGLRVGICLPGVAMDQKTRLRDGWEASRLQLMPFVVLLIFMVLTFGGMGLLTSIKSLYPTTTLGFASVIVMEWLKAMLSLSILTTLYGHYIEKRPLV